MLIAVAVFIPDPTPFQIFVFRVVLAIAVAAFGYAIPGVLHIEGRWLNLFVRAGGALGLFFLIYVANPPELEVQKPAERPHQGEPVNSVR